MEQKGLLVVKYGQNLLKNLFSEEIHKKISKKVTDGKRQRNF